MIRRTFQLVPGIGPWREKDLWARGFEEWGQVRTGGSAVLGRKLHETVCAAIDRAEAALDVRDLRALVQMLPAREHWRLWPLVADEALCLDIEADGVGERQRPTVEFARSQTYPEVRQSSVLRASFRLPGSTLAATDHPA